MQPLVCSLEKDYHLKRKRGISIEDGTVPVEAGPLVDVVPHSNQAKNHSQQVMVVEVARCALLVPLIEDVDHFFLQTTSPSRKATRDFIATEPDDV
jgi:hypothetical protein